MGVSNKDDAKCLESFAVFIIALQIEMVCGSMSLVVFAVLVELTYNYTQ